MIITWEQKRFSTFLVFTCQYFLSGVELSMSYTTSWLYLKQAIKDKNQLNVYYGLTHTATFFPSIIFVNVIAHYADKYRKIKVFILIANTFTIIGCILYLIPGSPFYILAGRFFIGFNLAIRPLMIGEMVRSYKSDDLNRKIQIFRGVFVLGKAAGPLGVVLFLRTNFWIAGLNIRYDNISSFITFLLTLIIQVLLIFFSYDLSNELDLKTLDINHAKTKKEIMLIEKSKLLESSSERQEKSDESTISIKGDTHTKQTNKQHLSSFQLLREALRDIDVVFLLISNFVEEGSSQLMMLLIPVVILENLTYSRSTVNLVFFVQLISFVIIFIILYFVKLKQINSALLGWFLGIIFFTGVTIVSRSFSYALNVSILICSLTLVDIFGLNLRVFYSISLASLVQSKYQCFMESLRMEVHFLSCISGALLAPISAHHLVEVGCTMIVIHWLILMITFIRRKTFTNISIKI